jgi:hypothetical protein
MSPADLAQRLCANCGHQSQYHVDAKCPFEASTFVPQKGFYVYELPGVGIGNIGAINKITFPDE